MKSQLIYLFAGFTVAWAVLFGYTFYLHKLQRRLEAELAVLRRVGGGQG